MKYKSFRSKVFCLTVSENFVGQSSSVSLIPISKKLGIGELGRIHNFPSKLFCLAKAKNLVGEPSLFHKFSGVEKFYG